MCVRRSFHNRFFTAVVNMGELNSTALAKARKAFARILQAFAENGKATAIAAILGETDSTISRIKNDKLEDSIKILYLLGFKVVESDSVTVPLTELQGLRACASRLLAYESKHGQLDGEEE